MKRATFIRASIYVASMLAGLTLVIGLLHTKAARPLLAHLGVRCPVRASSEDVEQARKNSARAERGAEAALSRPALGFALDHTTLADVKAWAERARVSCDEIRSGALLRCANVPEIAVGGGGPAIDQLDFGFAPNSARLVNISAWRRGLSGAAAADQMSTVLAGLRQQIGAPTRQAGEPTASYLAAGPMHTAVVEYRFSDYIADVSATNLAGRGLLLREHYMSARD